MISSPILILGPLVENKASDTEAQNSHQCRHQHHRREHISDNTPLERKPYQSHQQKKDGKELIKSLLSPVLLHI